MARVRDDRSFWAEFFSVSLYKRNQGRLVRQLTAVALSVVAVLGCYTMSQTILSNYDSNVQYGIPSALFVLAVWASYRLVNYPKFTDFLISVEAEMDKVSWADRHYLVRATGVVLGVMVVLATYLLICDALWSWVFKLIGFLRTGG